MAAQPAREMPQGPIISTEDRTFFVLPKKPTRVDQASYEYYVRGCVEKHLDTPDLVTPEQINPLYYRWLSALHVSAPDQSFALLSQKRSAVAFRLWSDNEGRKAGYASRYGPNYVGLHQWNTARNALPRCNVNQTLGFRNPRVSTGANLPLRLETTNSIYDIFSGKVFVLPAYHKHALVEIRFRKFRNDLRSVNPKYDQLGAFNPLRVYRVFRAFIEIALAFEEPFLIDTALGVAAAVTVLDGCEDFHRLIHPDTGIPLAQWDFDMIMVPHCVRYTQPAPPYDEFCRATQAVNPYLLIPDDLMAQIWKDVFECRVELGHTTREDADRVIAAATSKYANLFWRGAAMFDARSTPDVQTRPTLSGYDELFDCVLPSYPANRMIAVQKVGEGLIDPLAQPLWCDREKGDEFASFVENIEWLNPGVGRGLVVKAWNGLDWKNTGEDARVLGYASGSLEEIYPATVSDWAKDHWPTEDVLKERKLLEEDLNVALSTAVIASANKAVLVNFQQLAEMERLAKNRLQSDRRNERAALREERDEVDSASRRRRRTSGPSNESRRRTSGPNNESRVTLRDELRDNDTPWRGTAPRQQRPSHSLSTVPPGPRR